MDCVLISTRNKFKLDKYIDVINKYKVKRIKLKPSEWCYEDEDIKECTIIRFETIKDMENFRKDICQELILTDKMWELEYCESKHELKYDAIIEIYDTYRE